MMCRCVDPDPDECLSKRQQASLSLARLLAGCGCRCHTPAPGMLITKEQWEKNRKSMAVSPPLPSRDAILDPRIKALLEGGDA